MQAIAQYKAVIEERLHRDCEGIVQCVSQYILPRLVETEGNVEERAFFWKMVGDYYRYASEAAQATTSKE